MLPIPGEPSGGVNFARASEAQFIEVKRKPLQREGQDPLLKHQCKSPTLVGMKKVSLGPLEQEVMKCIWEKKTCTARDIVDCLNLKRKVAYNTVQTIMTRLVDKGLLKRNLQGKTHVYRPVAKQKRILQSLINQTMDVFTNQFGEDALIAFVDGLDDISEETRHKLIEKLQKK